MILWVVMLGGVKKCFKWEKFCCTQYLWNHTSNDFQLWYSCVKWYLHELFPFFSKFWFGGLLGCVKGQKIAQNDKTFCLLCSISQEPYIMWLSFVVHKCKMISPGIFYITFSKFWFGLLWGTKGEKWPKMLKKPVLGTIHHISWFMVHMCERTIPPGVFYIFSNFQGQ